MGKLATVYNSAISLSATIPASDFASGGTAQIGVTNPNSVVSTTVVLQIDNPVPTLLSIAPSSIVVGSSGTITLIGAGFVPASTVLLNGATLTPTYLNSTTLQLDLSSAQLAVATNDTVAVRNAAPAGGTSQQLTLQVIQIIPSIIAIAPLSVEAGAGAVPITITGTNFSPAATLQANGVSLPISAQTSSSISATLPAAMDVQSGPVSLVVTNPGANSQSSFGQISVVGVPAISSVTPAAAPIGSSDLAITIYGSNFLSGSAVQWNGQALSSQYGGNSQLTATLPAVDLNSFSNGALTVTTPVAYPAVTLTSAPQNFSTYLPLPNNGLVYNPFDGYLYASVPGSVMASEANCIVAVDPITGNIMRQIPVGSQPNQIAISDDGTQLFVGLDGAGAVRQVSLTTGQPGLQFSLGGGPGVYNPSYTAAALAVLPGEPNSVAVFATDGIVTIYDSGVARPNTSAGLINTYFDQNFGSLSFGSSAATLYLLAGPFGGVEELTVASSGIASGTNLDPNIGNYSADIQYDGRLYLPSGVVLDANSGAQLGSFYAGISQPATGPIVSDSTLGLAFVGYGSSFSAAQALAFNQSTFNPPAALMSLD
jgi:hypothetical protein